MQACLVSTNTELSKKTLEIPAFGRPFSLGTLYNALTDQVIPGKLNTERRFTLPRSICDYVARNSKRFYNT